VIDDFSPSLSLHVKWPSDDQAWLGNTLRPDDLQDEPTISLHDIQASSSHPERVPMTYVITLTDPDAPSRDNPEWSEYCHWVAWGRLKPAPCDPRNPAPCPPVLGDVHEVMPYQPPGPPRGTGEHRYVFLAFVPSNGTGDELHLSTPPARKHWGYETEGTKRTGVRKWARENGLAPVAANFIYAKH
ncbi:PEBP-like protein, partial [Trichocladium antarcticum]